MPSNRRVRVRGADDAVATTLREGLRRIQEEQDLPTVFPDEVEQAAAEAARHPRLPDLDRTDLPFVTLDPEGSMDLDQALHITADPEHDGGHLVYYAIADVAAFVTPGDALDVEANRRGQTLYAPGAKIPLHPYSISEDAGSLLPGQVRPALLWTIRVDDTGEGTDAHVERARVRSTARLTYEEAQRALDDGTADDPLRMLKQVGERRLAREAARGGVSLPLPEQVVDLGDGPGEDGRWTLEWRRLLPVEQWNAQISLLTGFAAASLMVYARVGLLRTLPDPDPRDVRRLHRTAAGLGIPWPAEVLYPDFIRSLDPTRPDHAAMIVACTRLLRGSGYVAFDGEVPAEPQHAGLASEYAHVTAPLRRLADRYALEVCVALCADAEVPDWVHQALPGLPATMQRSGHQANAYENATLNLVEAVLLEHRVGEEVTGTIVSVDDDDAKRGVLLVPSLGVEAAVTGDDDLPLGHEVTARLVTADVATRTVTFAVG
jgi:exoribonuclease R